MAQHAPEKGAHLLAQRESSLQMASPHLGARDRALLPKKLLHERLPASSAGKCLLEVVEPPQAALLFALLLCKLLLV